eukprot:Skav227704  [mRNA]  locus=scaffold79:2593:3036:+ [translate_table: standard]
MNAENATQGGLLHEWFCRYHPGVANQDLWTISFEEREGPRPLFKATLHAHSLRERKFESPTWFPSERLAETAVIKVFRDDPEVQEIARHLPPPQKRVKDSVRMTRAEKDPLEAHGFDTGMVLKELAQRVYIHFRDLGCRNAIWDGNA